MTTTTSEEHDSAAQRLHATHLERDRLDERYHAAIGTTTELGAYVRLGAAGDQVAALEAWLHWIDDEAYRGLNAGPFELLAESSDRVARPWEHTVAVSPDGSRRTERSDAGSSQEVEHQ
jgi:hypothetical protein